MFALTIVLSVALAAAMGLSFLRKARGAAQSRALRDRLGVPPALWQTIGVLEVAAAAGLLLGLLVWQVGVAAATGTALLMVGAVLAHLRVGIAGTVLLPPLALAALSVAVIVIHTRAS